MEGETNILNGSATLTEQSQKLASLTQAFTIPTGAKRLQFSIVNNNLVPDSGNKLPNDAFEVALLDANTFNPLAGTIGLSHSDSLLNIQANGTIHKSDRVTITPMVSDRKIITIDDVKLFTTNQNTTLTFNPIIDRPQYGTLNVPLNPFFTYTPDSNYVGSDRFTYIGFDADGQVSNLTTVNITINNVAPTIETVLIPNQIKEGQTVELSATAKDGRVTTQAYLPNHLSHYTNPYLSSPLQADLDDSRQSSTTFIGDNSTLTHNSILEQSSTLNPKNAYRMEEVGILEDRAANVRSIDVSPFQIGTGKIATHPRITEIAIAQVGIGKVGMGEVRTKENSSRQIDSAQIGFLRKTDIDKIPFSSSISFDQFLNRNIWREVKTSEFVPSGSEDIFSHPRPFTLKPESQSTLVFGGIDGQPIHNNFSNLLTSIYSTAQNLWQTTTPINLTFAITIYHPNATPSLKIEVRKLPSALNLAIINGINSRIGLLLAKKEIDTLRAKATQILLSQSQLVLTGLHQLR
jgi:hypothetical protein